LYSAYTLDELDDEEEILKELRQKSVGLLVQIKQLKQSLGLVEYKLCCELDAELDAVHAAYRRLTRSKSI
jgi:excinuclease UvrABC helicase subunit UvrB